jgi:tRNA-2-methylthio-N6-dimethylallyladenosine synthase
MGEVDGIRRVRFTTSHPRDFVKEIVDAIDANPVLCNHVHLPVQSGSSSVLERMQRLYTREDYLRRIDWMKQARRNIAITTDIIVGFPGETEAEFEQTLSLLEEVQYDSLFNFKYSRRPNTSALALDDHFPEEEKTRRLAVVQEMQRAIQIRRHSGLVGTVEQAFVEGYNQATGQWIGRTTQNRMLNFIHPEFPSPREGATLAGKYCNVRITRASPNSLAGERVN